MTLDDNVPRVQPTPASIDYEVAPQSNLLQYVDHAGYKTELGAEVEVRPRSCNSHWYRAVRLIWCWSVARTAVVLGVRLLALHTHGFLGGTVSFSVVLWCTIILVSAADCVMVVLLNMAE